jgi:hypothetical protein
VTVFILELKFNDKKNIYLFARVLLVLFVACNVIKLCTFFYKFIKVSNG